MEKNLILSHTQITHIIKRIAYQIYENNVDEKEIILAGISPNGFIFSKKIITVLKSISDLTVIHCEVKLNPNNPLIVETSIPSTNYINKSIILVDDVLNSGKTLIYGVKHFLNTPLKKLKTVVLVNRNHKKFPVKVDIKGLSLSTSLNEHIEVSFKKKQYTVSLNQL